MPFLIKLLLIPSVTWELSFHIRILYNFFNNTILISTSILISTLFHILINILLFSYKRKKLLDNYLSGIVEQDIYEETDVSLKTDLSNTKAKLEYFQQQADEESSLQRRIADFKKALSQNEVLEEFDKGIFESIIEKVIVGGYDENGEKAKKMCSDVSDKVKYVYSNISDNTCGDSGIIVQT